MASHAILNNHVQELEAKPMTGAEIQQEQQRLAEITRANLKQSAAGQMHIVMNAASTAQLQTMQQSKDQQSKEQQRNQLANVIRKQLEVEKMQMSRGCLSIIENALKVLLCRIVAVNFW